MATEAAEAAIAVTACGSLFEKPALAFASLRIKQQPKARSGSSKQTGRSEIGSFLDRLFPHGTFLDGLACERPGRISFYMPRRQSPAATTVALQSRAPSEMNASRAKQLITTPTLGSKAAGGGSKQSAALDDATTGAACDSSAAVGLKHGTKEERRLATMHRRIEEQQEYERSLKSEAQLQAEAAAQAKAEARQARIRERQRQQQQHQQHQQQQQQQQQRQRRQPPPRSHDAVTPPLEAMGAEDVSSPLAEARMRRIIILDIEGEDEEHNDAPSMQQHDVTHADKGAQPAGGGGGKARPAEVQARQAEAHKRMEQKRQEQAAAAAIAAARKEAAQRERVAKQSLANQEKAARLSRIREQRLEAASAVGAKMEAKAEAEAEAKAEAKAEGAESTTTSGERAAAETAVETAAQARAQTAAQAAAQRAAARVAAKEEAARQAKRATEKRMAERAAEFALKEQRAKAAAHAKSTAGAKRYQEEASSSSKAAPDAATLDRARQRLAELEALLEAKYGHEKDEEVEAEKPPEEEYGEEGAVAYAELERPVGYTADLETPVGSEAETTSHEAESEADYSACWQCAVAAGGCLRPCHLDEFKALRFGREASYEPSVYFSNDTTGDAVCEACFHAHFGEEERQALRVVEPI